MPKKPSAFTVTTIDPPVLYASPLKRVRLNLAAKKRESMIPPESSIQFERNPSSRDLSETGVHKIIPKSRKHAFMSNDTRDYVELDRAPYNSLSASRLPIIKRN